MKKEKPVQWKQTGQDVTKKEDLKVAKKIHLAPFKADAGNGVSFSGLGDFLALSSARGDGHSP